LPGTLPQAMLYDPFGKAIPYTFKKVFSI
jgi:hypothetical protein